MPGSNHCSAVGDGQSPPSLESSTLFMKLGKGLLSEVEQVFSVAFYSSNVLRLKFPEDKALNVYTKLS